MTNNSSVPAFRLERVEAAKKAANQYKNDHNQHDDDASADIDGVDNHEQVDNKSKEANDAAAWKGRLAKTQEELKAEREARTKAALEAAQVKEKARLIEEEATRNREALEEAKKKLAEYQQKERENFLSEDERRQLSESFGEDATELLTKVIAKVRPAPQADINDVLDKRLKEVDDKARQRDWISAVSRSIPEAHILRADDDFIKFAEERKDWYGNTALSVMDHIGSTRDVSRIGFIEKLISDYKNRNSEQQSYTDNNTIPPRSTPVSPSKPAGKKKVDSESFRMAVNGFKSRGDTAGLRKYLSSHEEV